MAKKYPVTYNVSFLHTYHTRPSSHFPKGHKKTVFRHKTVMASNPMAAIAKARKGYGAGHFHDFEVKPVESVATPSGPFIFQPVFRV